MNSGENLWPAIDTNIRLDSPKSLLLEQAKYLTEGTKRVLQGMIATNVTNDGISHRFLIAAPLLGNYKYELFHVSHNLSFYPAQIFRNGYVEYEVKNEEQLKSALKSLFSSDETMNVVNSLLSQSQEP